MSNPLQGHSPFNRAILRSWLIKALRMIAVTILFGWFYAWASPWCFPRNGVLGFPHGMLHGALMPMALPSLVVGKDVDIYAQNNSGRLYKLGYIAGINVCGLAFFGSMFWQPASRKQAPAPRPN